ncbi:hypothetical protein PZA11_006360 [Diplocarpon coronariae]
MELLPLCNCLKNDKLGKLVTKKYHRIIGKPVKNILAKKESSPENMLSVFMSRGLTATYLVSEALIGIIAGAHNSHSHAQHTHPHHGTRTRTLQAPSQD